MKLSGMSAFLCACISEVMLLGSVLAQEDALFMNQKKIGEERLATNIIGYVRSSGSMLIPIDVWLPAISKDGLGYLVRTDRGLRTIRAEQVEFVTVERYRELERASESQANLNRPPTTPGTSSLVPKATNSGLARFDSLTTLNGTPYRNVTVVRVQNDAIQVRHDSGGGRIPFEELPDDVLKKLGLPSKAEREEAQRRFEKEQQDKGLVKYDGRWVTPVEKERSEKEKSFSAQADRIVMSKFLAGARFKVLQATTDGALSVIGTRDSYFGTYSYSGDIFFLRGVPKAIVADDEEFASDLYWTGTYSYTTTLNADKTVNSYSMNRELALKFVRARFGLNDQGVKESEPRESAVREAGLGNARGFGSGFFVTDNGYLISNNHVVRGATSVKVKTETQLLDAKIIAQDPDNDVALIKVEGHFSPLRFSSRKNGSLGQTVFTIGFPIPTLQGFNPKVTKGVISSLTGLQDDVRSYQIDAAVQPGNSGGALADESGDVVGVVFARLSERASLAQAGTLPQNVNYAVKQSYITALLDSYPDVSKAMATAPSNQTISFEQAVEKVRKASVLVITY
jgi:S1-C subfamily serine protease